MKVADHVRGVSCFSFYRGGFLWFLTDTGLEFPVPVEDVEGATLTADTKSITLMRWIRKHLDSLRLAAEARASA